MALTFFWRCEGATLTGDDYTAGDTTATASGAIAIGATGAKVGTNGIYTTDGSDFYTFDTTSTLIAQINEGSLGFWVKFVSAMPAYAADIGVGFYGDAGGTTKSIITRISSTLAYLRVYDDAGASSTVTASGTSMAADTWYFVVARWDLTNDKAKVEVYTGTDTTPIQSAENTSFTVSAPSELANSAGVRIGNKDGGITSAMYFDNIFVSDDYDEPLHLYGNRDITTIDAFATSEPGPLLIPQYDRMFRQNTLLRL